MYYALGHLGEPNILIYSSHQWKWIEWVQKANQPRRPGSGDEQSLQVKSQGTEPANIQNILYAQQRETL